jgi:hypothetical protein
MANKYKRKHQSQGKQDMKETPMFLSRTEYFQVSGLCHLFVLSIFCVSFVVFVCRFVCILSLRQGRDKTREKREARKRQERDKNETRKSSQDKTRQQTGQYKYKRQDNTKDKTRHQKIRRHKRKDKAREDKT